MRNRASSSCCSTTSGWFAHPRRASTRPRLLRRRLSWSGRVDGASSRPPGRRRRPAGAVLTMHVEVETSSAEETREVGEAIAALLRARDAVMLAGELGSGKTTFAQGVARGLGIEEPVSSPTFTLVKEYSGILDLAHVDVYRLEHVQDVVDLGLEELGGGDDVLLVEWGDTIEELLPDDRLRVSSRRACRDDDGAIAISATGRRGSSGSRSSRRRSYRGWCGRDRRRDRHVDPPDLGRDRHRERDPREGERRGCRSPGVGDSVAAGAPGSQRPHDVTGRRASRSVSARACSRACGWGSRPRRRSHRSRDCRSSASRASTRSPTPSATRRGGSRP